MSSLTKRRQTALNAGMEAQRSPGGGGSTSVVSLSLSLAAIAVLHALTTSSEVGGQAWAAPGRRPDEVLVAVLAWVGLALAGWLALGSALALLSRLPGALGRSCALLAQHFTPMLLHRVLAAAVGTSTVSVALPPAMVVGTVAAPTSQAAQPQTSGGVMLVSQPGHSERNAAVAQLGSFHPPGRDTRGAEAEDRDTARAADSRGDSRGTSAISSPGYAPTPDLGPGFPPTPTSTSSARVTVDARAAGPGFRPTRPLPAHDATGARLLAPAPRPAAAALDTVTVRRGDSLWSIAQRHLGAIATDAEVARAWPEWYAANRAVIGDDPDLIHPGMQLVPPPEGDLR